MFSSLHMYLRVVLTLQSLQANTGYGQRHVNLAFGIRVPTHFPLKLYDTCVRHKTKWFIITSWNLWAFGGFSDGGFLLSANS